MKGRNNWPLVQSSDFSRCPDLLLRDRKRDEGDRRRTRACGNSLKLQPR